MVRNAAFGALSFMVTAVLIVAGGAQGSGFFA